MEITKSYKYLGLVLNEHIETNKMTTAVAKSANCALGLLIAKHNAFGEMLHDIYRILYGALVAPIIEYVAVLG